MNPKSVEYLRDFNDWRRGAGRHSDGDIPSRSTMPMPSEVGAAIDWACEQIDRVQAQRDELREKAQAVVDRWDSPNWKDLPHTGEFIAALRAAINAAKDQA